MDLSTYIKYIYNDLKFLSRDSTTWHLINTLENIVSVLMPKFALDKYKVVDEVAILETAMVESGVTLKPNTISGPRCIIKSGAYFRSGVYLTCDVTIGANCEIKQRQIIPKIY